MAAAAHSRLETTLANAAAPMPATICLRFSMLHLPLKDHASKSGRGGSVKRVQAPARDRI
jgi:hypothetical protein